MSTTWYETYTGKQVELLNFDESMLDLTDIGHALAYQCRYNGHCKAFYSVAEHSILVCEWVSKKIGEDKNLSIRERADIALAALFHDASEAYLADVPKPIKPQLTNYYEIEDKVEKVIADWLGIGAYHPWPDIVKEADVRILVDERAALMANTGNDWGLPPNGLDATIQCLEPHVAEAAFIFLAKTLLSIRERGEGMKEELFKKQMVKVVH